MYPISKQKQRNLPEINTEYRSIKRFIINRESYRTPTHRDGTMDSMLVTLSCGHTKKYKGINIPQGNQVYCNTCRDELTT